MTPVQCPSCQSNNLDGVPMDNGQIMVVCGDCGEEWPRGEPKRVYKGLDTYADLQRSFPRPDDVSSERRGRANELKAKYLIDNPAPKPEVAAYWAKYSRIFSPDGLQTAAP